ncbi:MAG: NfeD family protein [Anaerolineaceae bacterium]|nr:NfeD family protein [Anaerolineaceae bacterium]
MEILLNPNVAYLVLVCGFLLAILALLSPGTGLLELGAFFVLFLAGYAVYNLPINGWALVILLLGVFPFLVAVRRSGRMLYLVISLAALVVGSAFLFRSNSWAPAVNPLLALVTSSLTVGFLWLIANKVLQAMALKPSQDLDRLIGAVGETRTAVGDEGTVYVGGENWSARSLSPIPPNTRVRVLRRQGFILEVEPVKQTTPLPVS